MKLSVVILFSAFIAAGCASQSNVRLQQRAAFLAGQNAALRQQLQALSVTVIGPVQNSQVPWVEGLTLAQAIATANYLDPRAPERIVITRHGESATLDPKVLLQGADVPLEAGDVVEISP